MTFEDWFDSNEHASWDNACDVAREAWDYQQGRIKLLEQRVIDLQGHDELRYIDKKLSKQEGE